MTAGTRRFEQARTLVLIGAPLLLALLALLHAPGPLRFLATTMFVMTCPGFSVLTLAGYRLEPLVEWCVGAVIGWSLATLGSLALAYAQFWHPWTLVVALGLLSGVGGCVRLARSRGAIATVGTDVEPEDLVVIPSGDSE